MKATLRRLYEGDTRPGRWFRGALFVFDVVTVAYFLFTATSQIDATLIAVDLAIGAVVLADLSARIWIAGNRWKTVLSLGTLVDLVVVTSLAAPLFAGSNLAFLRVLRLLRLIRSFRLAQRLDRALRPLSINTRVSVAAANLAAFVFVVTSMVWVIEHDRNPDVQNYIDALYFTITTLTTTGYGDIILTDRIGRVLTIFIMIFGVGFFLQLIQAIYRPAKAEVECGECGLELHDRDASHCKHCGTVIRIPTEGET